MSEKEPSSRNEAPDGDASSDSIQFIRRQVLAAQKDAQQCVENAVAGARKTVESRMAAIGDTLAQTEQLVNLNQKKVESAFQQARDAVARTFEHFRNAPHSGNQGDG